jgi:hypothetical protein
MECMDLNQIQPQGKQTAWVVHCAPVATCIVLANWSGIWSTKLIAKNVSIKIAQSQASELSQTCAWYISSLLEVDPFSFIQGGTP